MRRVTFRRPDRLVGQLFESVPQLPRIIERQIGSGRLGLTQTNRFYGLTVTHSKIIAAFHEAGLTEADYPQHQHEKGYRTFARWVSAGSRIACPCACRVTKRLGK